MHSCMDGLKERLNVTMDGCILGWIAGWKVVCMLGIMESCISWSEGCLLGWMKGRKKG